MCLNRSAMSTRKFGALLVFILLAGGLPAQKLVVLTDADLKNEVAKAYRFSYENNSATFKLKHRFSRLGEMTVALASADQLKNRNFNLKESLPAKLAPNEILELNVSADYSKSIRLPVNLDLVVYPSGDQSAAERGVRVKLILSAAGRPMFWNERARTYSASLPPYEFVGSGSKMIELTWNGGGSGKAVYSKMNDDRNAFALVPNIPGAAPVEPGSLIPLGSGGRSYFVRYDRTGQSSGSGHQASMAFVETASGKSLKVEMLGTYPGGKNLFAMLRNKATGSGNQVGESNANNSGSGTTGNDDPGGTNNIKDIADAFASRTPGGSNDSASGLPPQASRPWATLEEAEKAAKSATWPAPSTYRDPSTNSGITTPGRTAPGGPSAPTNAATRPATRPVTSTPGAPPRPAAEPGKVYTLDEAQAMLQGIYDRRHKNNLFIVDETSFREDEEDNRYKTSMFIQLDSLQEDPNLNIDIHWVKAVTGGDSLDIPMTNVSYDADSSLLNVILPADMMTAVRKQDSFLLLAGFMPEYMAGNTPVNLLDQKQMFVGSTIAKVDYHSNWLLWLWILIGAVVVLFFVLGWLWVRQPIKSFRYLRESRYQRDRYRASTEGEKMATETVYVDLSRHDTDLIQLSFTERDGGMGAVQAGPPAAGNGSEGIAVAPQVRKFQELNATVTAPHRRGLRRFFIWFFGLFGMSKEPRFRSVYYSLRIENIPGAIPQHLRLKDESGLLLIGTSLTGNVLATDHQDFRFTKRPFGFRLYLDPAEILDYGGAMRSVSVPFRVIEEPFEGYVITRDFSLEMEIASKY